ncbi:hypothetical protein KUTeg_017527 [Tegillarca granosa]|uniref:C2H2-type domain-containing protein n=1 Tax=Tegillarca granosa TaxID=220873 RepID=A0ABQ9EGW8_TEGGR|nr:hypothetical protein KUTeg_017527 [Tegillarca granosa]
MKLFNWFDKAICSKPPVSLPEVSSRQNESRALAGFSSIIASAASHISTMDIPPPPLIDVAGRQTSSPCLQQPTAPPSGFPPAIPHGPRLNFLNPGHPQHPLPPVSTKNRNVIVESNPILDSAISCLDENELNGIDFEREESGAKRRKGRRPFFHLKNGDNRDLTNEEVYNGEYPMKTGDDMGASFNYSGDDSFSDKKSHNQPYAITSPSFNKASAKAVMTTTAADNATLVTVSIMNKLAGKKGKTKSVNVNQGNIAFPGVNNISNEDDCLREKADQIDSVDDENEVDTSGLLNDDADGSKNRELGIDKLSIMSKLKREKDENVAELDRMDFNVRIDDSQLIQHGDQKRWQCLLCPKSYTTKHNLVTHVLDHNGIKPHLCMVCGKYFKQLSHLNTHMLTHDQLKPHVCSVCGKGFTQISHLKRHEAVHLEAKPYICDICNRGFAYPSELRAHKDKHAQGKDHCEDCNEDFDSPQALKLHLMTHENKDELICKYCNKVFRYPSQLKDHIQSHNGTRPYICTECGMDFMKEHHLKAHQFTHTGLKPYECPECGRSFNQKANMQRHMLIHNATRAFKCEECGKTFTQPQTLKAHKVVHFETKPHQCKICGKQFGRLHNLQGNLNRHKKVKHGLNESTESMEEEAVNFLNTLSERARTSLDDDIEEGNNSFDLIDPDDSETQSSALDAKSPRKGRKSVPRKIPVNSANSDDEDEEEEAEDEEYDNEQEDTTDENKNVSQYFKSSDKNKDKESDNENERKVKNNKKDSEEKEKIKLAKIKSLRKRKAKDAVLDLPEDDESEKEDGVKNEEEDAEWTPLQVKRRKSGKAAKLDSIIEQKFKKS